MKRFFIFSALFLIFLSGCGGSEEDTFVVVETGEEVTLEGTLQSLGSSMTDSEATHLFRLEDGTTVYAYSELYDLSDALYLNQTVEAQGWLMPADEASEKELLRIDELSVIDVDEEEEGEVTMKPYVNESLGFAVLYQSDWSIDDWDTFITFWEPAPPDLSDEFSSNPDIQSNVMNLDSVTVMPQDNLQNLPVEDWYLEYANRSETEIYALSAIGLDQWPAVKVDRDYALIYYVEGKEQIFVLTAQFTDPSREADHRRLFAEMLYSFDLLSDGLREDLMPQEGDDGTTEEDTFDAPNEEDAGDSDSDTEANEDLLTETHQAVMKAMVGYAESGWEPTHYSFVEPSYVYVEFVEIEGDGSRRILYSYDEKVSTFGFVEFARFEPGATTDWELVSGENVAKGQPSIEVDAESTTAVSIPEGYSLMESTALHFQMAYPAAWYYGRSGDVYYFSDEPAEAANALVTLEWVSTPVEFFETTADEILVRISIPFDDSGSFALSGSPEYVDIITIMSQSLVLF